MVHKIRLFREVPTETVAAARKASLGQVVISGSPGKNNQAIIQISDVFMREVRGGQRIFTVLEGFQSEFWLQVEPVLTGRWTENFFPNLLLTTSCTKLNNKARKFNILRVEVKQNLA